MRFFVVFGHDVGAEEMLNKVSYRMRQKKNVRETQRPR